MKTFLLRISSIILCSVSTICLFSIVRVAAIDCPAGFAPVTYSGEKETCEPLTPTKTIQNQAQGTTDSGSTSGGVKNQAPKPAGGLRLQIGKNPACLAQGNCSLDDIVYTGTSAAQVLTVLSGALFLVAFIYGGFMYLISAGDEGKVTTGKTAMKTATIGMIIVMGAYVLIESVVTAIVSGK